VDIRGERKEVEKFRIQLSPSDRGGDGEDLSNGRCMTNDHTHQHQIDKPHININIINININATTTGNTASASEVVSK
jgi:hypothetical protein